MMDINRLQKLSGLTEATEEFVDVDTAKFFQTLASGEMSAADITYEQGSYSGTIVIKHKGKTFRVELNEQDGHPVYYN